MKKLLLLVPAFALIVSCGDSSESEQEETNTEEQEVEETFTPPDCPSSFITMKVIEWNSETDSEESSDYSFDIEGSAGSFENGKLMMMFGDAPNEDGMDIYDYLDTTSSCIQLTVTGAAVGDYDVTDGSIPVQAYRDGKSLSYLGSSSSFPDGEASGTLTITELSSEWICGNIDMVGYHGGNIYGEFSVALYPKY